jgi:hypothetical protein
MQQQQALKQQEQLSCMAAQGSAKKLKLTTSGAATLLPHKHQRRRKG